VRLVETGETAAAGHGLLAGAYGVLASRPRRETHASIDCDWLEMAATRASMARHKRLAHHSKIAGFVPKSRNSDSAKNMSLIAGISQMTALTAHW
jgi:hypothetical protein